MHFGTMQNVINESVGGVFSRAAQLGFVSVELDWGRPDDALPGGVLSPTMREMIPKTARLNDITVASVAAHFLNNGNIASAGASVVADAMVQIRRGITVCKEVGAKVLLVPFFFKGEIEGDEGIERLIRNLRTLAPDAEQAGVVLGIENTLSAAQNAAVVDAVNSAAVGVYWDMANGIAVGYDAVADVHTLGKRIVQVHAKEYAHDGGVTGTRANPRFDLLNKKPLGAGDVPLRGVLHALTQVGYTGYVVLETGVFGDHHTSARAALDALRAAHA
ncbi:MAG: sugar phosphate isomerase/epimerase [Chloroflexi bacterium]|nr:sugar phosphate isomerase/epimerase [Chloroflexota bacterium]